ncbi:hypothetical protein ACIRL2_29115 [Embleya sp. NPDC127516]|uniref:hypothetical protein n=1 Tax=Embleya sp. NPDC127516 TaxID=3363990 RepID=UPI00380F2CBE
MREPEPAVPMGAPEESTGDGLVQVAYLHPHIVSHCWHESVTALLLHDLDHDGRIVRSGGPIMVSCPTGGLVQARNSVMRQWLDETDHEWLWWIDTDMGFRPDTVDRLLAAADPATRPVVGALAYSAREIGPDGYGGRHITAVPTMYQVATDPQGRTGFAPVADVPPDTLVPVAGTGSACILIHRYVAEAIRRRHGDSWYDPIRYQDGRWVSEDLSFCRRVADASAPVHVHTGILATHHKQVWIGAPPPAAPRPGP